MDTQLNIDDNNKACMQCGKTFTGRADKKFCDDGCKNLFYNALRSKEQKEIHNVEEILRKNRRILKKWVGNRQARPIKYIDLANSKYNFTYHTHFRETQKGQYTFCFDYGFIEVEDEKVLIVKANYPL